ncbi:MAG: Fructan beta-fructosidase, partial [Verrucomicrobia bacterium]|nr:Fructan beta-fructosidase [Verrucomicrobiota bacterium]
MDARICRRWIAALIFAPAWVICVEAKEPASVERAVTLDRRFLNVPVKAEAPRRTISVIVDGKIVRAFEVELAEQEADFWAFTDLDEWHGHTAMLRIEPIGRLANAESQAISRAHPLTSAAAQVLQLGDEPVDAASIYHEPLRPQFHFTTRRGWLNDPHGPIFYRGEYHLFYQLQPFSETKPLNTDKSWGHAVSRDLVRWTEKPVALYPDEHGGNSSGSAVVDWRNSGGFQRGPDPALVLFYTCSTGRSALNPHPEGPGAYVQSIAYSNDSGQTWTKFAGNPVLETITPLNRDPQVFWHEPSKHWVMVLYVGYPISNPGNKYTAQVFNSDDLRHWTYQSRIEGFFDCPMLFELPLAGKPGDSRWIIHCANMKYKVGRFDGRTFTPETELIDSHVGKTEESAYAASNAVEVPGDRHIQLAWLYKKDPAPGVRQMLTFPNEIRLVSTERGPRMKWQPIREIESLYGARKFEQDLALKADAAPRSWNAGR